MYTFSFESYGVRVGLKCNDEAVFERSVAVIKSCLLGNLIEIDPILNEHVFCVESRENGLYLALGEEELADGGQARTFYSYFDSWVRLVVAEHSKDLVFLHCGAVAFNGKGILFPGDSFTGKTTLVAELVKLGATYYSDEYAIIDRAGLLHPFARPLALRDRVDLAKRTDVSAASLGGVVGTDPIPVAAVFFLTYREDAKWAPRRLSAGEGLMRLLPQAIPLRINSKFTLSALNRISKDATFYKSGRSTTENSINQILELIDKSIV